MLTTAAHEYINEICDTEAAVIILYKGHVLHSLESLPSFTIGNRCKEAGDENIS